MMFDLGPSGALSKVAYCGDGTANGLYLAPQYNSVFVLCPKRGHFVRAIFV